MIRVLLITGGHPYEQEPFLAMMNGLGGVTVDEVDYPEAAGRFARRPPVADALVFYDFAQEMDQRGRAGLRAQLNAGVGAVFLHHAIYSQTGWSEYRDIVGGLWRTESALVEGRECAPSTAEMAAFTVRSASATHPITSGIEPFEIADECYRNCHVDPSAIPLLVTDDPRSDPIVGWTKTHGPARTVYLQPGHGPAIYARSEYRLLLERSIGWVARP